MAKIRILIISTILLLMWNTHLVAEDGWHSYTSPGIQFGLSRGEGLFVGVQITFGGIYTTTDQGGNSQKSSLFPGMTIGLRKHFAGEKQLLGYGDMQVSTGFAGFGVGKSITKSQDNASWIFGNRVKFWGGSIVLFTYDYNHNQKLGRPHNWGIMGVLPFTDVTFID